MALHPRHVVRHAMIAALAGSTRAGASVESARVRPFAERNLPSISVDTPSETIDRDSIDGGPRILTRTIEVTVDCFVRISDGLADELDAFALEVEQAIDVELAKGHEMLGGGIEDLIYTGSETTRTNDGTVEIGVIRITYEVTYRRGAPAEYAEHDDLERVHTRYNLGGVQAPADESADEIVVGG